jgi:hypothetical protein
MRAMTATCGAYAAAAHGVRRDHELTGGEQIVAAR